MFIFPKSVTTLPLFQNLSHRTKQEAQSESDRKPLNPDSQYKFCQICAQRFRKRDFRKRVQFSPKPVTFNRKQIKKLISAHQRRKSCFGMCGAKICVFFRNRPFDQIFPKIDSKSRVFYYSIFCQKEIKKLFRFSKSLTDSQRANRCGPYRLSVLYQHVVLRVFVVLGLLLLKFGSFDKKQNLDFEQKKKLRHN